MPQPTNRHLEPVLRESLEYFRVIVVSGPRQAGKTTVVRKVLGDRGTFLSLDDRETRRAAEAAPVELIDRLRPPIAIDEVQLGGDDLVRAVKAVVDADPTPGQFLLNGSADFLTVPTISESLAGRAVLFQLWPFSQGEVEGTPEHFLPLAFDDPDRVVADAPAGIDRSDYLERICTGGYPEVLILPLAARRRWFRSYVDTVTQRDIVDLTGVRSAAQLPRLLTLLAARTSSELVVSNIHDVLGMGSRNSTDEYLGHLRLTQLVHLLPAWSRNLSARVVRRPKVHLVDSGLAADLVGKGPDALASPLEPMSGPLFESFVVQEVRRQASWADLPLKLFHVRESGGSEIDLVIEAPDGRIVAIEVKAASSAGRSDAHGLRWLRDKLGVDFIAGFVLHTGKRSWTLEDRIHATPISTLWKIG